MNRISKLALVLSAGLAATSNAQVALLQGVNPALDNSAVPGIEDARLGGATDWTGLTGSPDGNHWTFNGFLNTGSTINDEVVLLGTGPSTTSLDLVAREDDDASGAFGGATWGDFDTPRVNDMRTVAFSGDFDVLPTTEDDCIVSWNSGSFTLLAREFDDSSAVFGAGTFFDTIDSAVIDNDNRVGYRATSIDGLATAMDSALVFNGAVLAQEGDAIDGELWQLFDFLDYRISADGQTWLAQGDTDGATATDDIVAVNGNVVVREDSPHPALPLNVDFIQGIEMTASGDWFVDGDLTDDRDFVLRSDALIALVDDPTGLSTGENWDDTSFSTCFFMMVGNSVGDYIVGGLTNSTDSAADAVLVLNGTTEAMRENDPVDLDGNGMFDDDQFIRIFHNDDAVLTNDLKLYVLVTLQDGAGVETGEALIYKDLSGGAPTCPGDIADDFGSLGADGMVSFGDFLALLGLVGPCPGGTPGCPGDIADDFGTLGGDGMVSFGDFLALLGLVGPCP